VNVQFNDINKCYNISPSYYLTVTNNICIYKPGEYFYQNYQNNKIIGEFVYFDPINQYLYYNLIKGTFIVPPNMQPTEDWVWGTMGRNLLNKEIRVRTGTKK
jgi:hypothetical protein